MVKIGLICIAIIFRVTMLFSMGGAESNYLNFVISGEPDTLDPQKTTGTLTFQITRSLYDTLLEPTASGELIPALAKSWTFEDDGLSIQFELRDDVYFHHGKQFTADDVIATFERILEQGEDSPHVADFRSLESITKEDEHIVRFNLREQYSPILTVLASGWSAILPKDLIDRDHNFSLEPVGTGPFVFEGWEERQQVSMVANQQYTLGDNPKLDGIHFVFITDPSMQSQALIRGDVDGVDLIVEPELSILQNSEGVVVKVEPTALVLVLAMNTKHPILSQLEVRRAVNALIEKEMILRSAYGGGSPIETFMDIGSSFYPDSLVEADSVVSADEAQCILSQYAEEDELRIIAPQNFEPHVSAAQLYHEVLSMAGLPVRLEFYEWSRWLDSVYRGKDFEFTVIGHTGKLDPDARLSIFGSEDNYVQWGNSEVGNLIIQGQQTTDVEMRKKYYTEILQRMKDELPFVYVGTPNRYIALRDDVKHVIFQPQLETYDFRKTVKN